MAVRCEQDQYFQVAQAVVAAYPFSVSVWFYVMNATAPHTLFWVGDKDVATYWTALMARGNVAGDPVTAWSSKYGAAAGHGAETSTGFSASTWHHACGVWSGASSRTAYLDGGGKVVDTNTVGAMSGHDRTALGALRDSTPSAYMSGFLAEAAIWNVALSDAEVAVLAASYSPLFVRPQNLVSYLPAMHFVSNLQDIVGGFSFAPFNSPFIGRHPRIIYPTPKFYSPPAAGQTVLDYERKHRGVSRGAWRGAA